MAEVNPPHGLNTFIHTNRRLGSGEFSFVIWVYEGDYDLAVRTVRRLRQFNPQPILVIGDRVESFPAFPDLDFVCLSDSPKTLEYGDQYMFDRWSLALEWMKTPWICRLDPDNEIIREVEPIEADWFGYLYLSHYGVGCSGGSSGYSRQTIERLAACQNANYRITYKNGDGLTLMADDTLLIKYLGTELGITPQPWGPIVADLVFRRDFLAQGWMMSHPCLDKPLKAHLPRIMIDTGSSDKKRVAAALNEAGFNGLIYTDNPQPYREAGFTRFLTDPITNLKSSYKILTIEANNYHAGLHGLAIGGINDSTLWDAWFSPESCLYRKRATWQALNKAVVSPF